MNFSTSFKNLIFIMLLIAFSLLITSGCRTLFPPAKTDNPQPWAQPESWQKTQGIPGFSKSNEYDTY